MIAFKKKASWWKVEEFRNPREALSFYTDKRQRKKRQSDISLGMDKKNFP